ncbi:D-alanine--D-alanine ligase, partial [bacterium]
MVVYGGVSPEHDVAIVTALQVMKALRGAGFEVMPVYISKEGNWYLGDERFLKPETYKDIKALLSKSKKVIWSADPNFGLMEKNWWGFGATVRQPNVVFPVIHGRGGEDGTLQGLLEMAGTPYVGCSVTASAVKIDKYIAKKIAQTCGLEVLKDTLVIKGEKMGVTERKAIKYPVMVKPVGLGSSIGLTRVKNEKDLDDALEVAFCYDRRVIIEEALDDFSEVNISVMGNNPYEVSVTEEPKSSGKVLSFADKYEGQKEAKGMAGSKRLIPAKQKPEVIKEIEKGAVDFFRAIGGKGIARVDFMVDNKGKVYFNEINTMPGSLAFYLWEASGVPFE